MGVIRKARGLVMTRSKRLIVHLISNERFSPHPKPFPSPGGRG